MMH
jgi:protein farnesyltransferase subunit beta